MMRWRLLLLGVLLGCGAAALQYSAALAQEMPDVTLTDVDVTIPRLRVRPPVSETTLNIYQSLPARLYFSASSEVSLRLETNPYQAPREYDTFRESTMAFRNQTDATVGYALTPKTRVSANYFLLHDEYNDFTPYKLDSTVQSLALNVEQDLYQNERWLVRGAVTARQLFLPDNRYSGDLLPSLTAMRSLGNHGWVYGNATLDLHRQDFAIGNVDRLSSIFTVGTGYQVPWENPPRYLSPLRGVMLNASSSYTHNAMMKPPGDGNPWNFQSIILTGEVSRKVRRNWPIFLFVRSESVFNFGQDPQVIGLSGVNYRLFGGTRISTGKSPVFTTRLDQGTPAVTRTP